jgi:predicted transcriptional regulator
MVSSRNGNGSSSSSNASDFERMWKFKMQEFHSRKPRQSPSTYRDKFEMRSIFLTAMMEGRNTSTSLWRECKTSHKIFKERIAELVASGLVVMQSEMPRNGRKTPVKIFHLTDKGYEYLHLMSELKELCPNIDCIRITGS